MTYNDTCKKIAQLEAEAGCELPELVDPTLADRARRLLSCDESPRGEDRDFCFRLLSGNAIDD